VEAWLIALAIVALVVVVLLLIPIRVRMSLRGRGDPSGAWALAGGVQIGPLALSGVAARGVEPTFAAHALGRKLWSKRLGELLAAEADDQTSSAEAARRFAAEQRARYEKLERWFDPLDLLVFLVRERRRVRVERLEADVGYSFVDVALTGKTTAALYVLGGALPAPIVIRPDPRWEAEDRADLALSGAIRVYPGLVLVDTALFVVRRVKLRKRRATEAT
jgi:hypothetical protein